MLWRWPLYSANSIWRSVGASVSNTTAMWLGFSFFMTSNRVLVNPKIADVLKPFEVKRGVLLKAKCARYIRAIPSSRNNFFITDFDVLLQGDGGDTVTGRVFPRAVSPPPALWSTTPGYCN